MAYADFTYYKEKYFGSLIPEESFAFCSARASEYIDMRTFDRITDEYMQSNTTAASKIRSCCCELAENIYDYTIRAVDTEISGGAPAGIASEKNGQYSINYRSESEEQAKKLVLAIGNGGDLEKYYYSIILKHLGATGLLYRGVD